LNELGFLKNSVRQRLYRGETCYGAFITIGSPDVVDILKHLGFDWFVFDMEHSYVSTEKVKEMMQAIGGSGVSPIVRIGQIDQYLVKRALDIGSEGLLAPLVNSSEEVEKLVKFAMYPPQGVRGSGPARASNYGINLSEYMKTANNEILIAVQIETKEALASAEEILATKRLDLGFVGPNDLSISLGLEDRNSPKLVEALQRVAKICENNGKIPGTLAVSTEEAKKFSKIGYRFISLAGDARYLISGAKSFLSVKSDLV
jgi:2-dehydro-3-deoxyglucarate aldolase